MYIIFDKAAAPTVHFANEGDANYRHGYRIYAKGLPQSEKTALYVVPSQLNNGAQLYGVTYLPGIGVTQAIYGDVSSGAIGDLSILTLTLPTGGVQWTDDMPTEWFIKDSEGWQDLGQLQSAIYNNTTFGSIVDNTEIGPQTDITVLGYYIFSRTLSVGSYIYPLKDNTFYRVTLNTDTVSISLYNPSEIFEFTDSYNKNSGFGGITRDVISLSNNFFPLLIFAGQLTPVV